MRLIKRDAAHKGKMVPFFCVLNLSASLENECQNMNFLEGFEGKFGEDIIETVFDCNGETQESLIELNIT